MGAANRIGPQISVVVVAHTRREFLREAVTSVVEQNLDRDRFEIVVVKNYSDDAIDSFLNSVSARNLRVADVPIGPKLVAGIRESRGHLLTFLDYDDLYEPGRLRRILEVFNEHPDLGYYHNRFSYVDAAGRPLADRTFRGFRGTRLPGRTSLYLPNTAKQFQSSDLAGYFPDFNSSSAAIRRDVIEDSLPYLNRLFVAADSLLFFAGYSSERSILVDAEPLTRYRIHGGNSTLAGPGEAGARLERLREFAQNSDSDYAAIRDFLVRQRSGRFVDLLAARIWVNRLSIAFRRPDSPRSEFARLLGQLPAHMGTFPVREDILGLAGVLPFLLSPAIGRRLYQHQMGVR